MHEAHLRFAFNGLRSREPEAALVETVFDGDGADVRLHRGDHRLQPARDVIVVVVLFLVRFLGHGHDVHLLRHAINGAHEMSCGRVEPERADRDIPFGLSGTNAELT